MSRATPLMHEFAQRLIAIESEKALVSGIRTPVAFIVCEKLRPHLGTLMGKVGFSALLSRALALAVVEAPVLRAVRVQADGSLGGCEESVTPDQVRDLALASELLLAQLLGLLEAFIGQNLTLRMLRDVWPTLLTPDFNFSKDDQNEKA